MSSHHREWRERMQETDQGAADRVARSGREPAPAPERGRDGWQRPRADAPRGAESGARDTTVVEWKGYGKHRRCVNAPGHQEFLGWIDVPSGHLQLVDDTSVDAARELRRERERLHGSES